MVAILLQALRGSQLYRIGNRFRTAAPVACFHRTSSSGAVVVGDNNGQSVLLVNHGYPPLYNAGSEIYTQTLANGLQNCGVRCSVFSRYENPYQPDFTLDRTTDTINKDISVFLCNNAREKPYARFDSHQLDKAFRTVLDEQQPNVVHFNHLNHLSCNLVKLAKESGAIVVYTLHDFWLMCPRGQFLQTGLSDGEIFPHCSGQNNLKCAEKCFNRFPTGKKGFEDEETKYWETWVERRMDTVREAAEEVDIFIAPARHVKNKFVNEFGLPSSKVVHLPYGFDRKRFNVPPSFVRPDRPTVFGYIGRSVPAKGIDKLLKAFDQLDGNPELHIWGDRGDSYLTRTADTLSSKDRIRFRGLYDNQNIVPEVFSQCDIMVVPSIWDEVSPLVIHESQQARIPVITPSHGGMGELVQNGINGLTYEFRDQSDLQRALQQANEMPIHELQRLGQRGYLLSDGDIPSIEDHVDACLQVYERALHNQELPLPMGNSRKPFPWRITFDTNPDDCNFSCIMCEQHSEFSPHQIERKKLGIRRRRMDIDLIEDVIKEGAGRGLKEVIPTTMGEPMMYKHMPAILELCKKYNVQCNITTNGSFYGHGVRWWAERIVPVTSDIKISWNGATQETQETIMKTSEWNIMLKNLQTFIAYRDTVAGVGGNYCSVTLQLTFMECNLHELEKVVKLARENGVDRVKGHHLWAHFDEIKDQNLRRSHDSIQRWNLVAARCRDAAVTDMVSATGKPLRPVKLQNFYDLEDLEQLHPKSKCPFLGQEAWINHSGRFDPCCAPDEQRKTLGDFGNVTELGSFTELWKSENYKELVDGYGNNDLCRSCNMRVPPE